MMILWSMWREINERLWNNVQRPPNLVTLHSIAYLCEWIQIKEKNCVSQTPCLGNVCPKWHPSPHSLLKCNCDASVLYDNNELGFGAILKEDMSAFIAYKGLRLPRLPTVKEGEALALFEAMTWVHSMGYSMVIFEIDCKEVVDALQHGLPNDSNFGLILRRCHLLLCSEQSFKVVHVRRTANEAAHAIARRSRSV